MKGITYIKDIHNRKKAVVIELKSIKKNEEEIHELIDVLVAESRANDELISWEDAKKSCLTKNILSL